MSGPPADWLIECMNFEILVPPRADYNAISLSLSSVPGLTSPADPHAGGHMQNRTSCARAPYQLMKGYLERYPLH
jgi:hypothetical protein